MCVAERTPLRALVVDDEPHVLEVLTELLTDAGYELRVARDGLEALEVAARFDPDIVVLDVRMPRLDGSGFLREYRRAGGRAAVLVLTAAIESAVPPGADAALSKPFEVDHLLRAMETALARRRIS